MIFPPEKTYDSSFSELFLTPDQLAEKREREKFWNDFFDSLPVVKRERDWA